MYFRPTHGGANLPERMGWVEKHSCDTNSNEFLPRIRERDRIIMVELWKLSEVLSCGVRNTHIFVRFELVLVLVNGVLRNCSLFYFKVYLFMISSEKNVARPALADR